jgi:hypothetical protein
VRFVVTELEWDLQVEVSRYVVENLLSDPLKCRAKSLPWPAKYPSKRPHGMRLAPRA